MLYNHVKIVPIVSLPYLKIRVCTGSGAAAVSKLTQKHQASRITRNCCSRPLTTALHCCIRKQVFQLLYFVFFKRSHLPFFENAPGRCIFDKCTIAPRGDLEGYYRYTYSSTAVKQQYGTASKKRSVGLRPIFSLYYHHESTLSLPFIPSCHIQALLCRS